MFSSPQVNPAGTHVAALSSGGSENVKLVVHELESGDSWLVEGLGEVDVLRFRWLDSDRMVFTIKHSARGGGGLLAVNRQGRGRAYPVIQQAFASFMDSPLDSRESLLAHISAGGVTHVRGEVVVLDTNLDTASLVDATAASETERN